MKKLLTLAAVAVAAFALTSTTAEARPHSSHGHGHGGSSSCSRSYGHSNHSYRSYRSPGITLQFGVPYSYQYYNRYIPRPSYRSCAPVPRYYYYNRCR